MLEISNKTNLLEQSIYKYSLQDVENPNLYREMFNYEEVPKIAFNHRRVPMNMPTDIWITDTSFRDGMQSMAPYTVKQRVDLYKYLARLGGPYGIIRQSEFFIYTKQDQEAIEKCMELGYKFPAITTWIRAKKEDFKRVKELEIEETGILVSCSDYQLRADAEFFGISRVSAPGNARYVIRFIVHSVNGKHQVADFTPQRRCTLQRCFAKKTL